jgi:hypothetical protein
MKKSTAVELVAYLNEFSSVYGRSFPVAYAGELGSDEFSKAISQMNDLLGKIYNIIIADIEPSNDTAAVLYD